MREKMQFALRDKCNEISEILSKIRREKIPFRAKQLTNLASQVVEALFYSLPPYENEKLQIEMVREKMKAIPYTVEEIERLISEELSEARRKREREEVLKELRRALHTRARNRGRGGAEAIYHLAKANIAKKKGGSRWRI